MPVMLQLRSIPPEIRQKLQSTVQDPQNVTDNWDEKYCEEIFHRRYGNSVCNSMQREPAGQLYMSSIHNNMQCVHVQWRKKMFFNRGALKYIARKAR